MEEIRWQQRKQHFERALTLLNEVAVAPQLSILEQEGMVHRFEFTFELARKTMKDFLTLKGIALKYPRDVIKAAFQNELIEEGDAWIDMLDKRNTLLHIYDEEEFLKSVAFIKTVYTKLFNDLLIKLNTQI